MAYSPISKSKNKNLSDYDDHYYKVMINKKNREKL